MTAERPSILVLCTGNSARSQMAAGYLRHYLGDRFEILSAGTRPAAEIHPLAIDVMREVGVTVEGRPKDYREYLGGVAPRFVIIVCDGAAKECPAVWPGAMERLLWPFEDPAAAQGSGETRRRKFREVRDQIDRKVRDWATNVTAA